MDLESDPTGEQIPASSLILGDDNRDDAVSSSPDPIPVAGSSEHAVRSPVFSHDCSSLSPDFPENSDQFCPIEPKLEAPSPINGVKNPKSAADGSKRRSSIAPRWKPSTSPVMADDQQKLQQPMSEIVSLLQASLIGPPSMAVHVSSDSFLLESTQAQAELLHRSGFGKLINSCRGGWFFQLGAEEAFYLSYRLKCLSFADPSGEPIAGIDLWLHLKSARPSFPEQYKAYAHLRSKNWLVKSGMNYGVDFVAYRDHPERVHAEYAVLVVSDGDSGTRHESNCGRLKVWSDVHGAIRVCGSVAKTLLVLHVGIAGGGNLNLNSPDCLEGFAVHERAVVRWIPQRCREELELQVCEVR